MQQLTLLWPHCYHSPTLQPVSSATTLSCYINLWRVGKLHSFGGRLAILVTPRMYRWTSFVENVPAAVSRLYWFSVKCRPTPHTARSYHMQWFTETHSVYCDNVNPYKCSAYTCNRAVYAGNTVSCLSCDLQIAWLPKGGPPCLITLRYPRFPLNTALTTANSALYSRQTPRTVSLNAALNESEHYWTGGIIDRHAATEHPV